MQLVRSFIFTLVNSVSLIIFSIIGLLFFWTPLSNKLSTMYSRLSTFCVRTIAGVDVHIIGKENIPSSPCVIASNHQSTWETFFLQEAFYPLSTVLKRELTWIPIFGQALKVVLKPVSLDRSKKRASVMKVLRDGTSRLENGRHMLIFPEGTRIDYKRGLGNWSRGATQLAIHAGVPVVPVVHNAGYCWEKKSIMKKKGTVSIHIGQAIDTKGKSADEVQEVLISTVKKMYKNLPSPIKNSGL